MSGGFVPMRFGSGIRYLLIGIVYSAAFQLGMSFYFEPENVATMWPANGLVVGVLLVSRTRSWPAIIVVQAAIQLALDLFQLGNPLVFGLLTTMSNTLAALLIAFAMRRLSGAKGLERLKDTVTFVVVTMAGEGVGALAGALAVVFTYPNASLWSVWQSWWLADVIGILLVAPVVLGWGREMPLPASGTRRLEGAVLLLSTMALAQVIFASGSAHASWLLGSPYLIAPLLLWGALRFRPAISATTMLAVGMILVYHADHGRGPFVLADQSTTQLVLAVQAFLTFGCLTTMVVAAVLAERRQAERDLRASEDLFRSVIENAADAIFVHDTEGRILATNQQAMQNLGYTRDELLQLTLLDIETGLEPPKHETAHKIWDSLQPGEPLTFEGEHRRKDGSTLHRLQRPRGRGPRSRSRHHPVPRETTQTRGAIPRSPAGCREQAPADQRH